MRSDRRGKRERRVGMRARAREKKRERERLDLVSTRRRNVSARMARKRDATTRTTREEGRPRANATEIENEERGKTRRTRGGGEHSREWRGEWESGESARRAGVTGIRKCCKWRLAANVGASRTPFFFFSLSLSSPSFAALVVRERVLRARSPR